MAGRGAGSGVMVGRVDRAHGLEGEVVVTVVSDTVGRFACGAKLDLVSAIGERRAVEITSIRPHQGRLLVRFRGVDDRDAANALRGAVVEVDAGLVPLAPQGSYYYFDLIGCSCHDDNLGSIGRVTEVVEDGGGLLLAVKQAERTILVPFVNAYMKRIDPVAKLIEFDLPAGLLESCASRS
ncbi:MAG: ribosome maturation factor RimM [Acidobacteriota bacterium]|nr:ribosome maturation factor RimM [Acidobacteriota bacterium]